MAKKTLTCRRCKRTFSMPAHFARHMRAIHGRKKAGRAPKGAGRRGKRKGRARATRFAPTDAISRLIGSMKDYCLELETESVALAKRSRAATAALGVLQRIAQAKGP